MSALPVVPVELKYNVPSMVTEHPSSQPAVFTGAPIFSGSPQPSPDLRAIHISVSKPFFPPEGLLDIKKSFEPSGEIQGLRSLYFPENGAISGWLQRPFFRWETQMT